MMSRALLASIMLASTVAPALSQSANDAVKFLNGIYAGYVRSIVKNTPTPDLGDAIYSADLRKLWARVHRCEEQEGVVIDFDPLSASQDPGFRGFAIALAPASAQAGVTHAKVTLQKDPSRADVTIDIALVARDGHWTIDDVSYADQPSLRAQIADGLKSCPP